MPKKESSKTFNQRQNVVKDERNLFLGTKAQFGKFKKLMEIPIEYQDQQIVSTCSQPLQIRIMGSLEDVRDATKKLIRMYDLGADPKTSALGLTKLECDKKNRDGLYCSNTIRAYINPKGTGSPTCMQRKL